MNQVNGLKIEINQHRYMDNKLYVSIGIHAGFAYKEYVSLTDSTRRIKVNQASANVFMEYMRLAAMKQLGKTLRVNTTTNASVLTFLTTASAFDRDIHQVMELFYGHEMDEEVFAEAKINCEMNFKQNYKDIAFRAYTKMIEFSDKRKDFHFHHLTRDIQAIELADIKHFMELFVNFPNTVLLINGNTDKITEADFFHQLKETQKPGEVIVPSPHVAGMQPMEDQHLIAVDKESYSVGAMHFDFDPQVVPIHDQFALLQLIGHCLFKRDFAVSIDNFDASIQYQEHPLIEYKDQLSLSLTQGTVKEACLSIQEEVEYLLVEKPYQFNQLFLSLYVNGIDLIKYYVTIKTYQPEFIKKIMKQHYKAISECHMVLEQGAKVNYV